MSHTKGPWRQGEINYRIEANHSADGTHNLICEVASNKEADYKLIAAAPEMLEALLYVANDDGCPHHVAEVVMRAIRKAKGEL